MNIFINGKTAILKKGTSFEIVFENRSFTGSDGYSLSITFPLRGCPENLAIFGNINRADIEKSKVVFDCEIQDKNFSRSGVITIVEIGDKEVKAQFLEGRSEQNFDETFDEIYINELDLGEPDSLEPPSDPCAAWNGIDYGQEYVALPWVNNQSGNIQNEVVFADEAYQWGDHVDNLSFFPYLIVIAKRVCGALGYNCDFDEWDNSEDKKYIIICNVLPAAWELPQFARALPHWSVTEFFEKLERFLGCEFDINHKAKTISFAFTKTVLASASPVHIDSVVDSFTAGITDKDDSDYIENATIKYKECGHLMQKFYDCGWFVRDNMNSAVSYESLDELIDANKEHAKCRSYPRGSNVNKVLYAKDVDMYFVVRCLRYEYVETDRSGRDIYDRICVLQPINVFGERIGHKDSDCEIEIDFVPAWIDETEESKGNCLFLAVPAYDESYSTDATRPDDSEVATSGIYQPTAVNLLLKGESEGKSEYFDTIFVAFWDGANNNWGKLPCPTIDWVTVKEDWTYYISHFSMRLTRPSLNSVFNIEPKQKYTFSFLMNEIPDVRSVFFIKGKKYLCEKITATFSENGMSQLLKGNFYQVID